MPVFNFINILCVMRMYLILLTKNILEMIRLEKLLNWPLIISVLVYVIRAHKVYLYM